MTMISNLGFTRSRRPKIKSNFIYSAQEITIVIPVKDNQRGINAFLKGFFHTHTAERLPKEIIIVDNNSNPKIELNHDDSPIPVRLFECKKIGPASARNFGVKQAQTDWILFTDSDCIPTETFISGYFKVQNGSVGYAGNVKAYGNDVISRYYEQQEILMPPKVYEQPNNPRPDYLITANCLVWREAFEKVGGFNEQIKIAGGEDIDLGFKLLNIGQLTYAFDSVARHNFGNGLRDFQERFMRYGKGNRIVGELYKLDLKPKPFMPQKRTPINFVLAILQHHWMLKGYSKGITY